MTQARPLRPVSAREETLIIPTYPAPPPDPNPMFLDKRVNQGRERPGLSQSLHRSRLG
jgi:hypothetical protein